MPISNLETLKIKASWHPSAVEMHYAKQATIVDMGPSWAVYHQGEYLNVMSWEGHKGTPRNVPSVDYTTFLKVRSDYDYLEIPITNEDMLRGDGVILPVVEMLKLMKIEGTRLVLPEDVTFSSRSYRELKKVITDTGSAKYKDSAFVFETSEEALEVLNKLLSGEKINIKQTLQYFPTTDLAGEKLFDNVDLKGKVVFEPSAGTGNLARRALDCGAKKVLAAEVYGKFHSDLERAGAEIVGHDLFDIKGSSLIDVDVVMMNPPFSGGQDIDHVLYVLSIIPDHAELHAIMSHAVIDNNREKYFKFRQFIAENGMVPEPLEAGIFKESGTMVKTCIVRFPKRQTLKAAA